MPARPRPPGRALVRVLPHPLERGLQVEIADTLHARVCNDRVNVRPDHPARLARAGPARQPSALAVMGDQAAQELGKLAHHSSENRGYTVRCVSQKPLSVQKLPGCTPPS